MQTLNRPYKHLLWIRILLGVISLTNLAILFSSTPVFTHQQIEYSEFLDIHQFVLNTIVFIGCMHVFWGCYRFPSLVRLISGCCLVGANLAYPIGIFIKISRHNVGYGYGCAGYDANINGEGTSLKTRCYMQYMIGSLNIMISLLLAIEVGLSWRMSRDQEYIDFVEKERQELELKEMQRRERAMMIHYYQPNLTLDGKGENDEMQYTSRGSTSEDVLPEYQQRETTVGLGRLVDMSHIVNGEVEEVCPHPYIEVEGGQEGSGGEYLDPSPFSAEVVEVQIELPVSCPMVSTAEDGRSGSIARTNTNNESEADERCEEPRQLTDTVVIPIDQPPTYTP